MAATIGDIVRVSTGFADRGVTSDGGLAGEGVGDAVGSPGLVVLVGVAGDGMGVSALGCAVATDIPPGKGGCAVGGQASPLGLLWLALLGVRRRRIWGR